MLTGLSPKAQMDISKADVSPSVNIWAHHTDGLPMIKKKILSRRCPASLMTVYRMSRLIYMRLVDI